MRGQNFFQGGAARPLETGDRLTPEIFGSPEIFRSYRRKYSALIGLPKILRNLIYLSSILFWKSESVGVSDMDMDIHPLVHRPSWNVAVACNLTFQLSILIFYHNNEC